MKKISGAGLLGFVLLLPTYALANEEQLFVSSAQARLMSEPHFRAELVLELARGDAVVVFEHQGAWLRVGVGSGEHGWISRMLTSSSPPMERVTVLTGEEENSLRDVRRRTSAITTAAAARGLASSRRQQEETGLHPSNYAAVDWMETFEVSEAELDIFMQPLRGEAP